MAYTESANLQRQRISDMARSLSGSHYKRAELKEKRSQRRADVFGRGFDYLGGIIGQKQRGKQALGEIGARGEEERLGLQEQYAPASTFVEWDKARQEALAQSDFEGTKTLHEWLNNLSPDKQELYFRMLRSGTITTEDPNGLSGKDIISAMYLDYRGSAEARGEEPSEAAFRAWVDAELQPMPGFKNYTAQQVKSLKDSLEFWIPNLFQIEGDVGVGEQEPSFATTSQTKQREEEVLLQRVMAAQNAQMAKAGGGTGAAAVGQKWQPIIDEINQEGFLGMSRLVQIRDMVRKILGSRPPIQADPYLRMPQ